MSYQLAARDPEDLDELEAERDDAFSTLVGDSPALREAIALARKVSGRGGSNVLLVGETGTGKEVFARAIHSASPRSNAPFVAVNCAAIPAQLLESELFGHERGAFTDARRKKQGLLELAGEGTLFLDEVSSLPLDLQPKLLRALEERRVRRVGGFDEIEIRCRVTAATNVPLEKLVEDGGFREDLFYRLNVLRLWIPPLRRREGDVMRLAAHFLRELAVVQGLPPARLTVEACAALEAHSWPGNVRELKNVLERALVVCENGEIDARHLALGTRPVRAADDSETLGGVIQVPSAGRSLKSVEAELLALTLKITRGNKSAAARVLGISRPTLHRKIEEHALAAP
ncbi:MAG TPA: sigma 54-interacting transcriptional regulator [Longimicrobiales bacterium]|nr:sigma 54-interacting transcriptional regulator [Longimicrobiales bacterium]